MPYEEDVLRNPYSLKSWWRFIEFKQHSPPRSKNLIFERALRYNILLLLFNMTKGDTRQL